ncbi:MAG: TlpA family protein disulfide reductase [Campylobacter sp.]|nr:TlpA family protein disulfide reductase [Campylobacter sp.]
MKFIKFILAVVLSFFVVGCGDEQKSVVESAKFEPFKTGEKIVLKSVVGNEITLVRTEKGFKLDGSNKILMLDIFGTYCEPCKAEAPHLMDFSMKNSENFMLVGLIHFENITDKEIIENFVKKYNAYYFIANSSQNERIVKQILSDIDYKRALSIPFKVVFKDGVYQTLTDINDNDPKGAKYYLGQVSTAVITKDFDRIQNGN